MSGVDSQRRAFLSAAASVAGLAFVSPVFSQANEQAEPILSADQKKQVEALARTRARWSQKGSCCWVLGEDQPIEGTTPENIDAPFYTASLIKLLALAVVFDEIESGRLDIDELIPVSDWAYQRSDINTKLSALTVWDAIMAAALGSKNDTIIALAERVANGGPMDLREGLTVAKSAQLEARFTQMMQKKAFELGMNKTFAVNASGMPEYAQANGNSVLSASISTLRDMQKLYAHLYTRHRGFMDIFSQPSYTLLTDQEPHPAWVAERRRRKLDTKLPTETIINRNPFVEGSLDEKHPGGITGINFGKTGTTNASGCHLMVGGRWRNTQYFVTTIGHMNYDLRDQALLEQLHAAQGALEQRPKPVYEPIF